jgi:hypothetical protein
MNFSESLIHEVCDCTYQSLGCVWYHFRRKRYERRGPILCERKLECWSSHLRKCSFN